MSLTDEHDIMFLQPHERREIRNMSKKDRKKIRKQVRFFSIRRIAERLMGDKPITNSELTLLKDCLYHLTIWDENTLRYVPNTGCDEDVLTFKFKHYDQDYTFLVDTSDYKEYNDLNICVFYRYDDRVAIRLV